MAEIKSLSVSDTSSSVSFSSAVILAKIKNVGTSACYFNLDATATTDHFKLEPEDEIEVGLDDITAVHAICDSSETTTLNIIGEDLW
jgi:hypothetical protein